MRATHSYESNPQEGDHENDTTAFPDLIVAGDDMIQFGQTPSWIMFSGTNAAVRLYNILSLFKSPDDNVVFPGMDYLAYCMGYSRADKVRPHMDKLVEMGAVGRKRLKAPGGVKTRNVYAIYWSPPASYTGPRSTRDIKKELAKINKDAGHVDHPKWGDRDDQVKHTKSQIAPITPNEVVDNPKRGDCYNPKMGPYLEPHDLHPPLPPVDESPAVAEDDQNATDETEAIPEPDPGDMATVEALQHAYADTAPDVETTRGGDKNLENQNPDRDESTSILAEVFAGVEVNGHHAEVNRVKSQLVDALTAKLTAGATRAAALDAIGDVSIAKNPLKMALWRIDNRIDTNPGPNGARAAKAPWCGYCHESTRITNEDRPRRCPDCHPNPSPVNASDVQGTLRRSQRVNAKPDVKRKASDFVREQARIASEKRKQTAK